MIIIYPQRYKDVFCKLQDILDIPPSTWRDYNPLTKVGATSILKMEIEEYNSEPNPDMARQELLHVAAAALNLYKSLEEN